MLTLHPKTVGGSLAGAAALLVISIISHWLTVSPDEASAATVLFAGVGAYLAPWLPTPPRSKTHPSAPPSK